MPIYEYQCTKCDHYLEALQKLSDKPLRECPECGKHTLQRLVSAPMFRLAGSGWYETDFKSDKEQKRNLAGDKGEAEASSGSSDSSEKEPAAKPVKEGKESGDKKSVRTMVTKPVAKSAARARPAAKPSARKPAARKPATKTRKR
jgi:putative FmdB family regulatory protein